MWAPDVYQGAPTPVTAFLSVASKASGFAVLLRLTLSAMGPLQSDWQAIFIALAVVTMTVGNLAAIPQHNIKRLMGYSSIAMAGYLLVGMAALAAGGASSILLFLAAYTVTNLGAFAAIIAFSNATGSDEIEDYAGLASRSPLLALGFAFCLFSLIGIPPLAGFFGKFYVFAEAVNRGLLWLVVVALLNSAVSVFYYLRVVKVMYLNPARDTTPVRVAPSLGIVLAITAIGVVVLGIGIGPIMDTAAVAAAQIIR
jgi:NADH-quinone oxidoreductase subunit N